MSSDSISNYSLENPSECYLITSTVPPVSSTCSDTSSTASSLALSKRPFSHVWFNRWTADLISYFSAKFRDKHDDVGALNKEILLEPHQEELEQELEQDDFEDVKASNPETRLGYY
jgi:hypothetical protein